MDNARQKIHTKLTQRIHFLQILHLSSNRMVCNLTLYFQFTTLARELTHRMNLSTQEGTNFRHPMFLHYLEPEKCQKSTQKIARILNMPCSFTTLSQRNAKNLPRKQHEFWTRHNSLLPRASKTPKKPTKRREFRTKLHSLTPVTMPRKVLVFHNFAHRLKYIH